MGLFAGMEQFKAALHVHTTNSDGSVLFRDMIEAYYAQDYDLLAITDHNLVTRTWINPPTPNGLLASRVDEMATGFGRTSGRPMVMIPDSVEQSRSATPGPDHINTFLADTLSTTWSLLFPQIEGLNGVAHINHLGRYINSAPAGIGKYLDMLANPSCVGIEAISYHYLTNNDRPIWDSINSVMVPTGKIAWGFATDDSHTMSEVGQCFSMMVMPANTIANLRQAMHGGSFYGVARRTPFEGVPTPVGDPPMIIDIEVRRREITITATNYTRIEWITEGTQLVDVGDTLDLSKVQGSFVRANVIGAGGVAFSQPFPARIERTGSVPIEVLTRLKLRAPPVDPEDAARLEDIGTVSLGGTADEIKAGDTLTVTNAVGGYQIGDTLASADTLWDFLKRLLNPRVAAQYIAPTLGLTGTTPLAREIGENVTPTLTPTWTQHDGGALTQYRLFRGPTNIYTGAAAIAQTDTAFQLTVNVSYHAEAAYGQGPVKDDSEGNPDPAGQIPAGTATSSTVTYLAQRRAFFGKLTSAVVPDSSAFVRALEGGSLNPANGTTMIVDLVAGDRGCCFAYPNTLRAATSIMQQQLNMNVVAGFTEAILPVEGANGYLPIDYRVYYVLPEFAFSSAERFTLLI